MTRRALLRALAAGLPVGQGLLSPRALSAFSREEMPAQIARLYRDRCAADAVHAPTLVAAFARLDAAAIKYDRAEVAATLRRPICSRSVIFRPRGAGQRGARSGPLLNCRLCAGRPSAKPVAGGTIWG